MQELKNVTASYSTEAVKMAIAQSTLNKTQIEAILSAKGLTGETLETTTAELAQITTTNALSASQAGATASTSSLGLAVKGLGAKVKELSATIWSFLSTNPVGWIVAIIGAIIAATAAIATINKKIEEHRQKIIEASETARESIKSAKSELDNLESSAKKAVDTYGKLIDGIDTLNGKNISLSDEEYNEFISASNELAELFPQLVIGLDNEGNKILDLGNNAQDAMSKINELIESQRKLVAQQAEEDLIDVFKGISEETRNSNNELKQYQDNLDYINRSNPDEFIGALRGFDNNSKSIQLSDNYLSGLDSEIMMNNIASIINDADIIEKELIPQYNEMTEEWFLDLRDITAEDYEKIMNTLYLNEDILREKIIDNISDSISGSRDEINQTYKNELSTIFTALSDDAQYTGLSETNKKLADILISNLDYSEYRDEIKKQYNGNIVDFILNDELFAGLWNASEDEKQEINNIYTNLLAIDPEESLYENTKVIEQYINDLSELLNINADKLKIMLGYDLSDNEELINRVKEKVTGQSGTDARSVKSGYAAIQREIESLNEEDLILLDRVEIPDDVKRGTVEDFRKFMDNLREDANINIEISTDITSPLKDIKEAYSSFDDIYDEIINGSTVSADAIDKLNEKFGEINGGESLEKFKDVLTTMPNDIEAQHEALNQLATDYLDQSSLIQNLTVDNAEYTESELKKLGVENAHEVVQSRLIQHNYSEADAKAVLVNYLNAETDAKEKAKFASMDLSNATDGEIAGLINEANAIGIDTTALLSYFRQKIQASQVTLTTDGDIKNLIALVDGLGGATNALRAYQIAKQTIADDSIAHHEQLKNMEVAAKAEINKALRNASNTNVVYGGSSSYNRSSGSGSGNSSQEKDTIKQYNWIEVVINRVKEAISRLTKVRDNSYISWTKRNKALVSEISKVKEEIDIQRQAYDAYMSKANSIGLSEEYKQKVQNGTMQIEDIADENLQNQIDQYQEWYDKAIECSDAIQDLNINLSELAEQKFDNVKTEFESFISLVEGQAAIIDERINRTQEQGYFVSKTYYNNLIAYEKQSLSYLQTEYTRMVSARNEALSAGYIEEGSESWNDMTKEILDVQKAIEESTTKLIEFNNTIRDLDWEIFDYIEERIDNINQESDFLIDLLDNEKLYEDSGWLNSEGKSAVALRGVKYNTYMQQSLDYAKELKKIESDLANDTNNKDLIERREELLKLQQESIINANAEKDAIKSLVEEGIKIHLENLSKLIDKYKESLNAAKDLYEYQKNISEQTTEISNLEKIIMAYQGDDSEESKKIIQDTQNKLDEAKTTLQETQWDKYISETENLLDSLYTEYEETLNQRLDNLDALIADMIEMVNQNGSEIRDALNDTAEKVGYDITNTLNTIFGDGGKQSTLISNFMNKFDTYSTTTQAAINDIKNSIHTMMTQPATTVSSVNSSASNNSSNNNSTSSQSSSTNANQSSGSSSSATPSGSGDGIVTVGEHVTYISGRYHEDSWGNGRSGSKNINGQVYITKIKSGSPYPYHISTGSKLGNGDLGWVNLDQLRGYKTGSRYIDKDQLAWTQENGNEIIYRKSDGAMLTPLSVGDKVFTQEMSQNLWELAKGNFVGFDEYNIPNVKPVANNTSLNIDIGQVVADNPEDFTNQLKQHLATNRNVQKMVQELSIGQVNGNSKFKVNKYL